MFQHYWGRHQPGLWNILKEVYMLQCGSIHVAMWKYTCCNVEVYKLQCGSVHVAMWKYTCCNVEVYKLQCGSIHVAMWKYTCCNVEGISHSLQIYLQFQSLSNTLVLRKPRCEQDKHRLSDLRLWHHDTSPNMTTPHGTRHWIRHYVTINYPQPPPTSAIF